MIGGGKIAYRKVAVLREAGADVVVIAPDLCDELAKLAEAKRIRHERRPYRSGDLQGAALAFAASSDREAHAEAAREAAAANVPIDVVDAPETGSFISPAIIRRGDLMITVSTGGKAPAFAGALKSRLHTEYGPEYAAAVRIHQLVREKLLTENKTTSYTTSVLRAFAETDLPQLLKSRSQTDIDRLLLRIFGPGYTLAGLGAADKEAP